MPTLSSLVDVLMMYCLLAVPVLIYSVVRIVEVVRDKGKYLRCDHCGHAGRMTPVLANRYFRNAAGVLLCLGVLPGFIFVSWGSKRYPCRRCGTVSKHLPSSHSLSEY